MDASLVCSQCNRRYPLEPTTYLCETCGPDSRPNEPLRGVLDVDMPSPQASDLNHWLPLPRRFLPAIPVGQTKLWAPERLRAELGFPNLFIKDDTSNPTASLKDRASYLVAGFAIQHGIRRIALASTGNAASSMAGIGAAAGLEITLFLPKDAPPAKLIQSLQYGARVIRVEGNYDMAYELCLQYCKETGALSRNTAHQPLTIEGKKTVAIEIGLQLGRCPDTVFVPCGDGVILSGVYKGFLDLLQAGRMDRVPQIVAVQAEGSNALARAFEGQPFQAQPSQTVADSIAVDAPRNGYHALGNLQRHGGSVITVTDADILAAQLELSSRTGLFAEPAASAAFAGFKKLQHQLDPDQTHVLLMTGHGLKDIAAAQNLLPPLSQTISSLSDLK